MTTISLRDDGFQLSKSEWGILGDFGYISLLPNFAEPPLNSTDWLFTIGRLLISAIAYFPE